MVPSRQLRHLTTFALLALLVSCSSDSGPPDDGGNQNPPPGGGTPAGDPVTVQIGPGGGTITASNGGLSLTFPAGALASATDITVQPMVNTAAGGIGPSYRIQPAGLVVSQPVAVATVVDSAALGDASIDEVGMATRDNAGNWFAHVGSGSHAPAPVVGSLARRGGARSMSPGSVVLNELRFGDAGVIEVTVVTFWRVEPRAPRKVRTGQSIQLRVIACFRETQSVASSEGELAPLPHGPTTTCGPSVRQGTWTVTSLTGQTGSADVGTVRAGTPTSSATYTAPLRHVPGGAVDVVVSLYSPELQRTYPLHILVLVEQSSDWSGTVTWTINGTTERHVHNDDPMLPYLDITTEETREGSGEIQLHALPGRVFPAVAILDPAHIEARDHYKRVETTVTKDRSCTTTVVETVDVSGTHAESPTGIGMASGELQILFLEGNEYALGFTSVQWDGEGTVTTKTTVACTGEDDLVTTKTDPTTHTMGPEMSGGFGTADGYYHTQLNPATPNVLEGHADWTDGINPWATSTVTWSITRP